MKQQLKLLTVNANLQMVVTVLLKTLSMVALAFEEMRKPYAIGRDICLRKLGNTYQRKEIEKQMTHFKSTRFSKKTLSRHNTRVPSVIVCIVCSLRRFENECRTLYASLP